MSVSRFSNYAMDLDDYSDMLDDIRSYARHEYPEGSDIKGPFGASLNPYKKPKSSGKPVSQKKMKYSKYSGKSVASGMTGTGPRVPSKKFDTQGVIIKFENGRGTLTDLYNVLIGHATVNRAQILSAICYALVKNISILKLSDFDSFTNEIDYAAVGDTWRLVWRSVAGSDVAVATDSLVYTYVAGATQATLAAAVQVFIDTNFNESSQFVAFNYVPVISTNGNALMDLTNARLNLKIQAALKFQNQSTNSAASTTEDAVDNIPLYGKVYEGKGNGTPALVNGVNAGIARIALMSDQGNGVIAKLGSAASVDLEPMRPATYPAVKRYGKCMLDPGQIKTSLMISNHAGLLNKMWSQLWPRNAGVAKYPSNLGKFRFHVFEKILEVNTVPTRNIVVAYENQTDVSCIVSIKKRYVTNQVFVV